MKSLQRFAFLLFCLTGLICAQERQQPTGANSLENSTPKGPDDTEAQPQPKPPLRVRVSQGVSQAMILKKVQPVYPEEARRNRIEGSVVMQAIIDENGNVIELKLVSGDPQLASAALDAVRKWKYRPYLLNSKPVQLETLVTVNFELRIF
jgi:protein TonB